MLNLHITEYCNDFSVCQSLKTLSSLQQALRPKSGHPHHKVQQELR